MNRQHPGAREFSLRRITADILALSPEMLRLRLRSQPAALRNFRFSHQLSDLPHTSLSFEVGVEKVSREFNRTFTNRKCPHIAWNECRSAFKDLRFGDNDPTRRLKVVTKEIIAALLSYGYTLDAFEVFRIYRSMIVPLHEFVVPSSFISNSMPPEASRDLYLLLDVSRISQSNPHLPLVSDAFPSQKLEQVRQLYPDVFQTLMFAPAYDRARSFREILLKTGLSPARNLARYSIVFADPWPIPLTTFLHCYDMFYDMMQLGLKGVDSKFFYESFNQMRDATFRTNRIDLFRSFVKVKIQRGFHIRTNEYAQLVILLAQNNLLEEAMQLFLSVIKFASFESSMEVNMFMVKAIMDAMLRQDQPDGAFQLLQQAKEVGIPATDILHGTLMRLSLARQEFDTVESLYHRYRQKWIAASSKPVNGFQINADPMVYACMLECAIARGNWDRALATLSELSRDGLTISAIPTEWLLKTVSMCVDKNEVAKGYQLFILFVNSGAIKLQNCIEFFSEFKPVDVQSSLNFNPEQPTSIFFSADHFNCTLQKELKHASFPTYSCNRILSNLVVALADNSLGPAFSDACLNVFAISWSNGFQLSAAAFEAAISSACSKRDIVLASAIISACKGMSEVDLSSVRVSVQALVQSASRLDPSSPFVPFLNNNYVDHMIVLKNPRPAPAVTQPMYSSIILAHCQLANSSTTSSQRLEQQKHIVQLFTSMVSRIAVLDSSSEIGLGVMENAFALKSYAQVVDAYFRLIYGSHCSVEVERRALTLCFEALFHLIPRNQTYQEELTLVLARAIECRLEQSLLLSFNLLRALTSKIGFRKRFPFRALPHFQLSTDDGVDDSVILDVDEKSADSNLWLSVTTQEELVKFICENLSCMPSREDSSSNYSELLAVLKTISQLRPSQVALTSDQKMVIFKAITSLCSFDATSDFDVVLNYFCQLQVEFESDADITRWLSQPELWALLINTSSQNISIERLHRIWSTDLVKFKVDRSNPLLTSVFACAFVNVTMPSTALRWISLCQAKSDDLIVHLDAMFSSGIHSIPDGTQIDIDEIVSNVPQSSAQDSARRLVLECAIRSWVQSGRFDLALSAFSQWLSFDSKIKTSQHALFSIGPSSEAYDAVLAGCANWIFQLSSGVSGVDSTCRLPNTSVLNDLIPVSSPVLPWMESGVFDLRDTVSFLCRSEDVARIRFFQSVSQTLMARLFLNSKLHTNQSVIAESHIISFMRSLAASDQFFSAFDFVEDLAILGAPISSSIMCAMLRLEVSQSPRAGREILESRIDDIFAAHDGLCDNDLMSLLALAVSVDNFELAMKIIAADQRNFPRRNFSRAPSSSGGIDIRKLPSIFQGFSKWSQQQGFQHGLHFHSFVEIVVKANIREWLLRSQSVDLGSVLTVRAGMDSKFRGVVQIICESLELPATVDGGNVMIDVEPIRTGSLAHNLTRFATKVERLL